MAEYEYHVWRRFSRFVNDPEQRDLMTRHMSKKGKENFNKELVDMPKAFFDQFCDLVAYIIEHEHFFLDTNECLDYIKQDFVFKTTLIKIDARNYNSKRGFSWARVFSSSVRKQWGNVVG
jgi:hypothetical protein